MKKLLCFTVAIITLLSLVACSSTKQQNDNTPPPAESPALDVIGLGHKVVYDISDSNAVSVMSDMLSKIQAKLGVKPSSMNSNNPEAEYEIQLGIKSGRPESEAVFHKLLSLIKR